MTSKLDLVIARYQEDVSWVRKVPSSVSVYVYDKSCEGENKSEALKSQIEKRRKSFFRGKKVEKINWVSLPNQGREAHTYLRHLIDYYDRLADVTVFCQGHPFDHASDFHQQLKNLDENNLQAARFQWFGFIIDTDDKEGKRLFQTWSKNPEKSPLPMEKCYRYLFDCDAPETFVFYCGAQFAVSSKGVRSRPRSFYEKILRFVEETELAPHCLERIWDRVFGVQGVDPNIMQGEPCVYLKPVKKKNG